MRKLGHPAAIALFVLGLSVSAGTDVVSVVTAAEPIRVSLTIKQRKADQKVVRVKQGDSLELVFSSDEAAELHLHGYDKLVRVAPAAPAVLRIDATIAGRFPIEAHDFGDQPASTRKQAHVILLYLEIYPR
jgi:hypothetical protein